MELEVDGERLFESFTNFVQLNPCTSFCAFLFGHRDEQRVIVTFFAKVTIEISIEKQIFFLNDALLSDMELLGVLCVDDVENIDEEFLQDVAGGSVIQLKTSYEALLAKDFEAIRAELNGERVTLRNERYTNESDDNCIIATTSISVTLEFQTRQNLNSDLEEQFARIAHRVERLSFLTKDQGLYLGEETESDALVEYLKVNKYDKTFLPLTAVEDLTSDDGDGDESMLVPVVHLRNKLYSAYHRLTFTVQAWAKLRPSDSTECILRFLRLSLLRQLNAAHLSITKYSTAKKFVLSEGRLFFPSDFPVRLVVRYPQLDDENQYEDFRDFLHSTFNLAKNRPIFRPVMSIANGNSTNLLRNPHLAITTYKPLGRLSLVKGSYDYHHYMQDGMDDNGWGCAYRSLQTIWSWFRLQGYTEKAVPTHRQIQQVLVDIGDREANFVGSRQWIGSLELSYVLENMLGISSRIVTSNSGPEVVEKGRQLAMHFDQQGSPVMIGGGMLAHTILGVDFDEDSGECRFLVLDPHYTGEEDQKIVLNKGWCAWKPASFWSRGDFYNMLLPMPPMDVF